MLNFGIEPAVVAAAGLAVVLTLVVAGLVPALQLTRPNPGRTLAADSGGALIRWRGRSNLIALQVGVSVGLFLLTVISVRFIVQPPSQRFMATADMPGLAIANVPFDAQQYDEGRARRAIETVLDGPSPLAGDPDGRCDHGFPGDDARPEGFIGLSPGGGARTIVRRWSRDVDR